MKNILSNAKTTLILLLVTILALGFYAYMLLRPISYGMAYHNEAVYDGETFEGTIIFYPNGKLLNENTNFDKALEHYYYYKDGYVFTLTAQTDAEYEAEVASINENFDEALAAPFYASRLNAFRQDTIEKLDDYNTTYICSGAITFAIAGGIASLALLALTAMSFILFKRSKAN
jgi:hypothetical protein